MLADLQRAETVFLRRSRMAGQTHTDQAGVTREQTRGLGGAALSSCVSGQQHHSPAVAPYCPDLRTACSYYLFHSNLEVILLK